jgi:hypothetical protein
MYQLDTPKRKTVCALRATQTSLSGDTPALAEHWKRVLVGDKGAKRPLGATMLIKAGLEAPARRFWRIRPSSKASLVVKWGATRDSSMRRISASW